jgi:hypothetical protein
MIRRISIFLVLSLGLALLVLGILAFQKANHKSALNQLAKDKIIDQVRKCVAYNPNISNKKEIHLLLDELETKGVSIHKGSDELRVKFVTVQGCLEHVLTCMQSSNEIHGLTGIIHTPNPATPLCTKPDPLDTELLDASIRKDLNKLLTVHSRAQIVRDYLLQGGKLHVVYPLGGLEKRTQEQQVIYKEELVKFPHSLFETVLSTSKMDPDQVGATYFFRNDLNQVFVFSIKSRQANDPQDLSEWGIWIGSIEEPKINQRIQEIFSYLKTNGGPELDHFKI